MFFFFVFFSLQQAINANYDKALITIIITIDSRVEGHYSTIYVITQPSSPILYPLLFGHVHVHVQILTLEWYMYQMTTCRPILRLHPKEHAFLILQVTQQVEAWD